MSNIKDVAKLAQVAPSTVSNVINKKEVVKEETKQRVYRAIDELGFKPNHVARSLKSKKTSMIGILIPDIGNAFYTAFVRGVEDMAEKYNYTVVLCNTDESPSKERSYVVNLEQKDIDGLILCSSLLTESELLELDVPLVLVDKLTDNDRLCTININNTKGGYVATEYLINKGKKNIAILTGPLYYHHFQSRLEGYQKALSDNKISFNYDYVMQCKPNMLAGYTAMRELYEKHPEIDCVFGENDLIAIGAIKYFLEKGIRIPEQVSVVGFDNTEFSTTINPSLTTIDQPQYKIGTMAMKNLLKIIESKDKNKEMEKKHIVLEPGLVERKST